MKKNLSSKKIELKKIIISNLTGSEQEKVKGGSITIGTNTKTCPETYLCVASVMPDTTAEGCK